MSKDNDYLFKLILIGDSIVGKTSLLTCFADKTDTNITDDDIKSTIGIDFKFRTIKIDNNLIKLQIWDVTEQEYNNISSVYYKGADGIMIIYDITNLESFNNIKNWLHDIDKYASDGVNKILVGNKSDLESKREVSYSKGKDFADSLDIGFFETSAKKYIGIEEALEEISIKIKEKIYKNSNPKLVEPDNKHSCLIN
jgi:Ras-related protein Rab-1A